LHGQWQEIAGRPGVQVQTIQRGGEVFVLARSNDRAAKETAIRKRPLIALQRSFRRLALLLSKGRLKSPRKAYRRLGRLEERHASVWPYLEEAEIVEQAGGLRLIWRWSKARLRNIRLRDGAYLLRSNLEPLDPDLLWRQYIQLTD